MQNIVLKPINRYWPESLHPFATTAAYILRFFRPFRVNAWGFYRVHSFQILRKFNRLYSTVGWADDRKPNSGGDTGYGVGAIENVVFVASSIASYAECWA